MARSKVPASREARKAARKALESKLKSAAKSLAKTKAAPKPAPKAKPKPKAVKLAAPPSSAPAATPVPAPAPSGKPVPPAAFFPTIKVVDAGVWYRVHEVDSKGNYAGNAFNDSGKGRARFSPLFRTDGSVIPTIYAAAHERTAIAEILLHEAPIPSTNWTFDWGKDRDPRISTKHLSVIKLPALKLAALTTFGLLAAGLLIEDLLGGNAPEYPRTQAWALWLYENMPDIQGLYWMSRRDNEYGCVMLFGDRVSGVENLSTVHISEREAVVLSTVIAMGATATF
jgi:hypothetical protein